MAAASRSTVSLRLLQVFLDPGITGRNRQQVKQLLQAAGATLLSREPPSSTPGVLLLLVLLHQAAS